MDLTFLGTSAGTPTKVRNVTALALQHGNSRGWYLIDCGEGTQHQILRTRHSLVRLRAIFITHVHGDHCYGLPGLLASASMAGRKEKLYIVAPGPIKTMIEAVLLASDTRLDYELAFIDVGALGFRWEDQAVRVTTVPLSHRVPCYAYVFTENDVPKQLLTDRLEESGVKAGPVWGRLQKGENVTLEDGRLILSDEYTAIRRRPRRVVVGGDNDNPDLLQEACAEAQLLVHEATYTQEVADRVGPAPQHSSAALVARFAESVGLPHLVLTHFSSRYQMMSAGGPQVSEIAVEARRYYRGNLHLAEDFATYCLNTDMSLSAPATVGSGSFRS
ncbi:MAG: MBL fold metallo-hydrolase [Alteromonadaceae bacterium]|nr:MBL fold metallo-hydrolase [Alteromonadaceae bacterium]